MKKLVEAYERVRASGRYNMATDAEAVAAEMGCPISEYFEILEHYSEYMEKFGVERL